jgi:hypothetical protein
VAVLIAAPEDKEMERLILAHTPRFRRLLDAAEGRIQQTGGVGHEEFWQSADKAFGNSKSGPLSLHFFVIVKQQPGRSFYP